jgi:hypothetical protein
MWRYCKDQKECDTGKSYYYGWLKNMGLDDTKPYQKPQEKFSWAEPYFKYLKEDELAKYFKVEVLFPLSSMNNNVYTEDELLRAARSLIGKTPNWDHTSEMAPEVQVYDADYEDDCVECLLRVLKGSKALDLIEKGDVIHVSPESQCLRGSELTPEGSVCKGQIFTGLALLRKDVLPGVPLTRIMPVEKLVESFAVMDGKNVSEKGAEGLRQEEKNLQSNAQPPVTPLATSSSSQTGLAESKDELHEKIKDLQDKYESLKTDLEQLKKPKEDPKRESCKCVLTKEGFWARFHQLRSEGASKSEAFRLVSLEVIEAATKKSL